MRGIRLYGLILAVLLRCLGLVIGMSSKTLIHDSSFLHDEEKSEILFPSP